MRELKFRAWDKEDKMYWNDIQDYRKIECAGYGPPLIYHFNDFLDDSYIVEQFTGLRDKNGKEIYEGDIVRFITDKPCEIKYKNGGFGYMNYGDFISFAGHSYLEELMVHALVIGNIHENPELLEARP